MSDQTNDFLIEEIRRIKNDLGVKVDRLQETLDNRFNDLNTRLSRIEGEKIAQKESRGLRINVANILIQGAIAAGTIVTLLILIHF